MINIVAAGTKKGQFSRFLPSSALVLGLVGVAIHLGGSLLWPYRPSTPQFLLAVGAGFIFLGLAYRLLKMQRLSWRWLLAVGIALRLVWLAHPPGLSEDVYRYLWDGLLSVEGINPYPSPPQALESMQQAHPEVYSRMAHVTRTSIYPPVGQFLFLASVLLFGPNSFGWRILLLAVEALLVVLWRRGAGSAPHRVALWLLNPLIVIEFYSSGHLDLLPAALLSGALIFVDKTRLRPWLRDSLSAFLVSWAILIKFFPAFALPVVVAHLPSWFRRLRYLGLVIVCATAPTALFLAVWGVPGESLAAFWEIVNTYRGIWRFNSLPFLLYKDDHEWLREIAERLILIGTVAIAAAPLAARSLSQLLGKAPGKTGDPIVATATSFYFISMLVYACSHTVHPWYVSWGLIAYPILGMRYWAGLYLSGAAFLSYLAYWFQPPGEQLLVLWIEWVPFYLLLVRDAIVHLISSRRRGEDPPCVSKPVESLQ